MTIYDRWGIKLLESKDMNVGWDGEYNGQPVQMDVYVWKVKYSVATYEGSIEENSRVGHVTVVR